MADVSETVERLLERLDAWSKYSFDQMHQETARNLFAEAATTIRALSAPSPAEDTVEFVQQWMMSSDYKPDQWHRDFAAAIDARCSALSPSSVEALSQYGYQELFNAIGAAVHVHGRQAISISVEKFRAALAPKPDEVTTGWDHRYRPLKEGEIVLPTDEVRRDDGTWVTGVCVGSPAPDPNYTSHRVYRRLKPSPDRATEGEDALSRERIKLHAQAFDSFEEAPHDAS